MKHKWKENVWDAPCVNCHILTSEAYKYAFDSLECPTTEKKEMETPWHMDSSGPFEPWALADWVTHESPDYN